MSTPLRWEELEGDPERARVRGGRRARACGGARRPVRAGRRAGAAACPSSDSGATVRLRMVDWSLARSSRDSPPGAEARATAGLDVAGACAEMEPHVAGLHRPRAGGRPRRRPEVVTTADWASVNLDSLSQMLDPVAERLDERLAFAGPAGGRAARRAPPRRSRRRSGLVMGYMSQRVLGQYDVSLLGGDAPPRLLFVAPNLDKAVRELEVDAERVRPLGLRPRADPRLPVPGRALAARAPGRPPARATSRRWRCGSSAAAAGACRPCPIPRSSSRRSATAGWRRSCRPRAARPDERASRRRWR